MNKLCISRVRETLKLKFHKLFTTDRGDFNKLELKLFNPEKRALGPYGRPLIGQSSKIWISQNRRYPPSHQNFLNAYFLADPDFKIYPPPPVFLDFQKLKQGLCQEFFSPEKSALGP